MKPPDFQLRRTGRSMEPEHGNPNKLEGVLDPALARGPQGRRDLPLPGHQTEACREAGFGHAAKSACPGRCFTRDCEAGQLRVVGLHPIVNTSHRFQTGY